MARAAGAAWPGTVPQIGAAAGWVLAAILAIAQCVIITIGARALIRARRDGWPLVAFPIVYACAFLASTTGHVLIFPWYLAPLTPFYFLFMVGEIAAVARAVRRPLWRELSLLYLPLPKSRDGNFGRPSPPSRWM